MHHAIPRPSPPKRLVTLVPLIDVMLILLVFFMVTSTYLDLNMVPVVERGAAPATSGANGSPQTRLVRIAADGTAYFRGQPLSDAVLGELSRDLDQNPLLSVLVFPSAQANTQALISTMEDLTAIGASRLRLVRVSTE